MNILEDLKQRLDKAIEQASINLTADRHEFEKAKQRLKDREEEEKEPITAILREYLDISLKDSNGATIRDGLILTTEKGYPSYVVKSRGMQFLFGTPMHNPRAICLRYDALKKEVVGKKTKEFHPSELATMQIVGEYAEITQK